jgi:hypothetical protein
MPPSNDLPPDENGYEYTSPFIKSQTTNNERNTSK